MNFVLFNEILFCDVVGIMDVMGCEVGVLVNVVDVGNGFVGFFCCGLIKFLLFG